MKKSAGLVVLASLVVLLSLGCVSSGTYEQVVAERDGLNQQLQTRTTERDGVKLDLTAAVAELGNVKIERDNAQRDLVAARTETTSVKGERDTARRDLAAVKSELDKAKAEPAKPLIDPIFLAGSEKTRNYVKVAAGLLKLSATGVRVDDPASLLTLAETTLAVNAADDQYLVATWDRFLTASAAGGSPTERASVTTDLMAALAQRLAQTR